jgi:Fe-S cluster assembly iron-binding protein IscA
LVLLAALAVVAPGSAHAIQHEVRILLDLDNDLSSGCLVPTVAGPFEGVDQVLITTVETSSPPPAGMVTDVAISDCIDEATDTFGPPASFDGGWPIGIDNGLGGLDVVETYFPLLSSVVPGPVIVRVGLVVTDELGGEQALLTTDGTPEGAPILIDLLAISDIPTLGEWALILLALLLASASIALLGRRGATAAFLVVLVLGAGVAWAAGTLDGLTDDWLGSDLLASNGMALFGKEEGGDLCFRVDVELLFNTGPTADPQDVSTPEDTSVGITLTGSDPESDPLTFTIVPGSGPDHGTLTGVPPNVTYDPDPDYNGPDAFDFQVEDPSGETDTATVQITVTDENDAPAVDPATFGLAENSPNGTSVGTVTFTDVDTGQSHTFAITAGNTGGAFAIDPTTGEITVATSAAVDFETNPTFSLTVEVTDDGTPPLTGSATVTVNLSDVNDPPAVADQAFSVDENAANGTSVGTVAASDEDLPAQTLTFAITAGNTGGAFAINASTGEITVANSAALDAETNPSFSLTVQVTDDGAPNESSTATVTVTVNDLNEAPVADDATFSVDENAANGTSVGTATFTDPDAGQSHTFAITAGNTGGAFAIDASTGEITVASSAAIDFETNPTFSLTVEVTDDGVPPLSDTATVTINVDDLNEAPVADDATFSVDENAANGTSVGTATFTDDDPGQTHTFAITAGNTGGAFAINASTGEITVATSAAVDFETNPSFSLTVEVTDDGAPPLSDTATITINVNDQNEAPVANDVAASIDENEPNGTSVVTVTFTDDDVGQSHTFAITAGNTGGAFAINASTGEITVATSAAVDFETNPSFSLTVEVTDDGVPPLSDTATVTINVDDLNEAPVADDATFSVDENSANGTSVGTVTFTDDDVGQNHAFAITAGNTGGAFAIDASTGEITVATSAAVDFETNPTFSLTVEVTDDGAPPLSDTATITINVNDLNEAPVANDVAASIDENEPNGTSVVTVTFTDDDVGQNHTFAITAGNTGGAFAIDANTGEITVATSAAVDFETNPSFTLTVEVTDDGVPALSDTATVNITVNDLNEAPVADDATFAVDENSANGTSVGTVTFTDDDVGQVHSFAITGGNTGGAFAINASTGEITVATSTAVDFETNPTFSLTVEVTDDGVPALSDTATITVNVNDLNEPPTAVDDPVATDEDTPITILVLDNDTDPDAGDTLTIISVSASTGAVINNGTDLSYDPTAAFNSLPQGGVAIDSFTYTIQDTGGLQSTATVTVTVGGLNDDPVADDETYSAVGNTRLAVEKVGPFGEATYVSSLADVLDGDTDPDTGDSVSVVAFSGDPAGAPVGDFLDIAADGSFFYTPAPGHTAPTTFDYTVQDTFGGTDTGSVTINIAKMVWYVDNTANGGAVNTGAGTSTDPFSTLSDGAGNSAADDAEDASAAGHILYVFQGSGTTNMDQGIALKNQQKLWGEGVSLIVDIDDGGPEAPQTLFTGNAANKPHVTRTGAGDAVNVLANTANNRVEIEILGLQLSSSAGNAIDVTSANDANLGVTIAENNISGAALEGVEVNAGSTSTTQTLGIHENAFQATGPALDVTRTAGTVTITSFHDNTVSGDSAGAGLVVNGPVTFDASTTAGIQAVPGGTTVIGQPGNRIGGAGLSLTSVTGALNFNHLASGTIGAGDLDIYTDSGAALSVSGVGGFALDVTPNAGTLVANAGPAAVLSGLAANLQLNLLTSTTSSSGVSLTTVSGTFSAPSGSSITKSSGGGTAFDVNNGAAGTTVLASSFAGPITNNSATGRSVSVNSADSGSSVSFAGEVTDTGQGVTLTSNTGATMSFTGGLDLSTGANTGFNATGGGTVTVTDPAGATNNTITTTSGTALTVTNTTIGASGLTFERISAGTAASGPSRGIELNNTGTSGGLTITGGASAGDGGTIQRCAIGISLTSTRGVVLNDVNMSNFTDWAIRGASVVNFTADNLQISGTNGDNDATDDGSVRFTELTGSATISNSSISGGHEDNVVVLNTTGTLNRITISNTIIGANGTNFGDNGILFEASGTATLNATVTGGTFTSTRGDHVQFSATTGSPVGDFVLTGNTFSNNHPNTVSGAGGIRVTTGGAGSTVNVTYNISNNTINGARGTAIGATEGIGTGTLVGTLSENNIGTAGVANSGSLEGSGISIVMAELGSHTATITDNDIRQYNINGIIAQAGGGASASSGNLKVIATGNGIGNFGNNGAVAPPAGRNGFHLNSGTFPGDTFTVCVDLGGAGALENSMVGSGDGVGSGTDFRFRQRQNTTVYLPGYGGANNNDAAVVTYVQNRNAGTPTGTVTNTVGLGGGGYLGNCPF